MTKILKMFEMFAGYGGGSFALNRLNLNYDCVGYSEIDKHAIQCYEQNHLGIKNYGDCTKIDTSTIDDFDLLLGGFPCQPFSQAGKHKGQIDIRGTLFYDIVRVLRDKQPSYFLLENVKGLTYSNHVDTFNTILSKLNEVGYKVQYRVLTSRDYGIPQSRKRLYIVGIRSDLPTTYSFPPPQKLTTFLKDILNTKKDIVSIARRNKNRSKHQHLGLPYGSFPIEYHYTHNKDLGVSYTIKSALHECMIGEYDGENYSNIRKLTPIECFKLMGFKDGEIKLDNIAKTHLHKLAGNGWDINIISKILKPLLTEYKQVIK